MRPTSTGRCTTLPRPLFNLRSHLEIEQTLVASLIPELTEAELAGDQPEMAWKWLLSRMHAGIVKWSRKFGEDKGADSP